MTFKLACTDRQLEKLSMCFSHRTSCIY